MSERAVAAYDPQVFDAAVRILKGALAANASDIHLKARVAPLVRIEGEICPLEHPALSAEFVQTVAAELANLAGVPADRFVEKQIDFACLVPNVGRFRVHAYRQSATMALALRRIPHPIPELATLRAPPVIKRIALAPRGMVLVTGATGMGKSTTIAAMLDYINANAARHVVTIEEPIEFMFEDRHSSFSQREVGRDIDTVQQGLEGALREDPDIVFVGETRTLFEMDIVMAAAESGRMVITTLHSADAAKTLTKIINMYPLDHRDAARNRLADSLRAIVSQRLIRRRGARERILATEVLTMSPTVQDCIRDPNRLRGLNQALDAGRHEYGSHSFDLTLKEFVRDGLITLDTARAAATNPADLVRNLKVTR
ncbi:MAG: PilT/PilU family type 4a pilus ATPase [Proteobacteria bacterium]|nr:PilT/PilU family type 4a pilus ATPase [Pseudomonadota bacterium]